MLIILNLGIKGGIYLSLKQILSRSDISDLSQLLRQQSKHSRKWNYFNYFGRKSSFKKSAGMPLRRHHQSYLTRPGRVGWNFLTVAQTFKSVMKTSSHSLSWTPSHQLSSSCRCWGSLLGDPYPHWTESSAERREERAERMELRQRGRERGGGVCGEVRRRGGDEGKKDRGVEKYAWGREGRGW